MKFIKALISALVVIGVILILGPDKILTSMRGIPIWALGISFIFVLLAVTNYGLRIWVLGRSLHPISLKECIKKSSFAFALGSFSPGRLGEMILLKSLQKEKLSLGQTSAIFITDRINALAGIALFSILAVLILAPFQSEGILTIGVIVILGFALLFLSSERGMALIKRFMFKKIATKMKGFSNAIREMKGWALSTNFFLNVFNLILRSFSVYILLLAMHQSISFFVLICVNAIVTLAAFLPISMSGLGVREGSAVFLLNLFGLNSASVAGAYFASTLLTYVVAGMLIPFAGKPYKARKE